ncbi:polysaccharide deacetylase family protein [Fusobacterium varium]
MKKKSKIILTFDYEIYFGKESGTIEKCMIEPTEALLNKLNFYNIKGIFFIDILFYIKMLNHSELTEKAKLMKEQIKKMVESGHRVELHLHPHWLDTEYKNKKWIFKSYKRYRFNSLDKIVREKVFQMGINELEKICREVKDDYKIEGFRAGGWCIQPFEDFYEYFKKYQIKYDSSVAYGISGKSGGHYFDFSNTPSKEKYKFSKMVEKEETKGEFIEFTISTYKKNLLEKIYNKIMAPKFSKFGDGVGMNLKVDKKIDVIKNKLRPSICMYSIEGNFYHDYLIKKLRQEKKDSILFISHPKGMTKCGIDFIDKLMEERFETILLR